MRQSTFTKDLSVTGKNGTVTGIITVRMNCHTETIEHENRSLHETETRTIFIHKIEAKIDNSLWYKTDKLKSEDAILKSTEQYKKEMLIEMEKLANSEPIDSFSKKFEAI